jgi:hypothetical protein
MANGDRDEIVEIINRYGVAIDTENWDLFDTIFTSDVDADYGPRHWYDLASWKRDFDHHHHHFDLTQHAMLNHCISIDGDTAKAFTYVNWRLVLYGTEGGDYLTGFAYYDDALIRTADGWRIKHRICNVTWSEGNVLVTKVPGEKVRELRTASIRERARNGEMFYLEAVKR